LISKQAKLPFVFIISKQFLLLGRSFLPCCVLLPPHVSSDGVNCGLRGNWSYVTPPLWNGTDTWSSIQDHANNTYSCIRSVTPGNGTNAVDTQYCSWDTGEEEFFDLVQDPWQLQNSASGLLPDQSRSLRARLQRLRACKGRAECSVAGAAEAI